MLSRPAFFSGMLRVFAVAVGGAGVGTMLMPQGAAERPVSRRLAAARPAPAQPPAAGPRDAWALQIGGWYIRVGAADSTAADLDAALLPVAATPASISAFDHLIVHHARAEGFDWRLIAALIFEESRFNPTSRSDKGAYGLMQVRPIAAQAVGAVRFETPEDNVRTGVRYLRHLEEIFSQARGRDRLCLVLAAYNMGPGHVQDAQALARRLGYDPYRWDQSMERVLPLLEQPQIHSQLPNGFAKGTATVAYVRRILERFRSYREETASGAGLSSDAEPANG